MRLFYSLLAFFILHSLGVASGRWETGLDEGLYGDIPRATPTPEPLLYREEFKQGSIMMEIRLGYPSNRTSRRDLALSSRKLSCSPGYVASCPVTNPAPCCPLTHPNCCESASPTICCGDGTFCVGLATCCLDGQVGCVNPEGCCPRGSKCCGLYCCTEGYECRSGTCVNPALSSLSVTALCAPFSTKEQPHPFLCLKWARKVHASAEQSSLESVASVRSKSFESELSVASVQSDKLATATSGDSSTVTTSSIGNGNGNNNSNSNVALIGEVIGAFLGVTVLGLIGFLLWRRTRGTPASQPILPATSVAFSTNPNYIGGPPPLTHAAHPAWHPQQSSLISLPGPSVVKLASHHGNLPPPPPTVKMWIEGPSTIHKGTYGRPASQLRSLQQLPTEGPVDPRGLYSDALRGSTPPVVAPLNAPSSASRRLPHVPPYSFVSKKAEFSG